MTKELPKLNEKLIDDLIYQTERFVEMLNSEIRDLQEGTLFAKECAFIRLKQTINQWLLNQYHGGLLIQTGHNMRALNKIDPDSSMDQFLNQIDREKPYHPIYENNDGEFIGFEICNPLDNNIFAEKEPPFHGLDRLLDMLRGAVNPNG